MLEIAGSRLGAHVARLHSLPSARNGTAWGYYLKLDVHRGAWARSNGAR